VTDHLTEILLALADREVAFIVGGGVAAVLHGVERVTMDLDVAVCWDDANLRGFLGVMRALGLKPKMPVAAEILLNPANLRPLLAQKGAMVFSFQDPDDPIRCVDVFIRPELAYDALAPDARDIDLRGRRIRIVSCRKLLALKQQIAPPRPKDELDISALKAMLEREDD
jgi:hypothetical protein